MKIWFACICTTNGITYRNGRILAKDVVEAATKYRKICLPVAGSTVQFIEDPKWVL